MRAVVDESDAIELRIVVDGASAAGKTATARAIGACLGRPMITPKERTTGRTLLFDWMDHVDGGSDEPAIRTQVVAVRGHRPHLRARLLVTADVVLFVADTTDRGLDAAAVALAQVRELLSTMWLPRPGLVIQANKRDQPDARPLDEVRQRLGLAVDDLVIETTATEGDGVRQSYVYAVRLGLQHARARRARRVAEHQPTAEDLLAQIDQEPRPLRLVPPLAPEPERSPRPDRSTRLHGPAGTEALAPSPPRSPSSIAARPWKAAPPPSRRWLDR